MITTVQESIVSGLSAAMVGMTSVTAHGGAFNEAELRRWAVKTPCGIVVPIQANSSKMVSTTLVVDVEWAFFIVTTGSSQINRHNQALNFAALAMRTIANNRWGNENAQVANSIKWESLYNGSLDSAGVTIHSISWNQGVCIGDGFADGDFLDLQRIYTSIAVTADEATINAEDMIELEEP